MHVVDGEIKYVENGIIPETMITMVSDQVRACLRGRSARRRVC